MNVLLESLLVLLSKVLIAQYKCDVEIAGIPLTNNFNTGFLLLLCVMDTFTVKPVYIGHTI